VYISSPRRETISHELHAFASAVITPQIFNWIHDAETHQPTFTTHTTFGKPQSVLRTSEGWRALSAFGIENGIVATAYEAEDGHLARVVQFLKYHLWTGSCAITTCPGAMTDGAAKLLSTHVGDGVGDATQRVFREAYRNLISRDPARAWTSGQWMTERSGGSDVRGTETVATLIEGEEHGTDADGLPLGPWSVSGFKWFSSATDCNMAVLLAKTEKGISAFYAPMRRAVTEQDVANVNCESNGIKIQRLKPKMGTKPLPTAELVLENTRAYLLGTEGAGVREISTILNITRIHTAVSAIGFWGRGLGISRAFARVRKLNDGTPLEKVPAHVRSLARNTINYTAMMHVCFLAVAALGVAERPHSFESLADEDYTGPVTSVREAAAIVRLITPVAKAMCSKNAITGLQECMESLGGVGYLEDEQEHNIARLYRDANVLSIWEGTTDVMAADVVRVVTGKQGADIRWVFGNWVKRRISSWGMEWAHAEELIRAENGKLEEWFANMDKDELAYKGRDVLEKIAWIVAAVMMVEDANTDADRVAVEMARRWILRREAELETLPGVWKRDVNLDCQIAFPVTQVESIAKL
jgi:alkylation response protein AidB-like acyl-CoA dehydrogenase